MTDRPTAAGMSLANFTAKIEWEGGVIDALDYGLKHTHLTGDDEVTRELRAEEAIIVRWAEDIVAANEALTDALSAVTHEFTPDDGCRELRSHPIHWTPDRVLADLSGHSGGESDGS